MREATLPDFPDYRIRDDGNIWSVREGRLLKKTLDRSNGYEVVRLRLSKYNFKKVYVHRLLAMAFLEKPEGKNFIDHINGNRADNRLENLRWCTSKENNNFPLAKKHRDEWINSEEGKQTIIRKGLEHRRLIVDETVKLIFNGVQEGQRILGLSEGGSCMTRCNEGFRARGHVIAYYDPEKHKDYEYYSPEKHAHLFCSGLEGIGKPVLCVTDGKLFRRACDAAWHYDTSLNNIARCARGERKTTVGKRFRYVTWEEFNKLKEDMEVISA